MINDSKISLLSCDPFESTHSAERTMQETKWCQHIPAPTLHIIERHQLLEVCFSSLLRVTVKVITMTRPGDALAEITKKHVAYQDLCPHVQLFLHTM